MGPKFRGDSNDWLDDEDRAKTRNFSAQVKKSVAARAVGLSPEKANGTVSEVFQSLCRVKLDSAQEGQEDLLCNYRRAGVVGKSKAETRERAPVAVGDRVYAKEVEGGPGLVEGICARINCISRPAPGRENRKLQHVLAANIDLLVIVVSAEQPTFSAGLVDRFLVAAEVENVPRLVCVTKIDLMTHRPWTLYEELGYSVVEVCAKQSSGIDLLLNQILGKTVVFCGQSGVGKTSLLRALLGAEIGRVGEVNPHTGKGRHTTTGAVLLGGPNQSKWIDTPGVKEFGLAQVSAQALSSYFKEFRNFPCDQSTCQHLDEPGCAVKDLPRYPSYRRILTSILEIED